MVNAINLSLDKSVCKDLKNLSELQKTDPRIKKIRVRIAQQPTLSDTRYRLVNDTLFYREARHASEWKPVLPACSGRKGYPTHPQNFRAFRGRKMHAADQAGVPP